MSKGGRRVNKHAQARSRSPYPYLVALGLGVVLSVVAWVYLVRAAIDFGRLARSGEPAAWALTVAATLGAMLCALLVVVLIGRALRAVGFVSDYRPRRAGNRRRER